MMEIPLGTAMNGFDTFILVLVRMSGIFVISPIFGRRNVPAYFKIGFAFFLALILVNTTAVSIPEYGESIYGYALIVIKEFIVGLTIGYISYMVFSAIFIAGQLIDMQIGFGMVNVLDPMSNIQLPVTANFYYIVALLFFLQLGGHHMMIKSLFDSYKFIPIGEAVFGSTLQGGIISLFTGTFVTALKISAPVIAAVFIVDVSLGVMAKTIPQMNVFVVGMPLKILVGLLVVYFTIPVFINIVEGLVSMMDTQMLKFIEGMGLK